MTLLLILWFISHLKTPFVCFRVVLFLLQPASRQTSTWCCWSTAPRAFGRKTLSWSRSSSTRWGRFLRPSHLRWKTRTCKHVPARLVQSVAFYWDKTHVFSPKQQSVGLFVCFGDKKWWKWWSGGPLTEHACLLPSPPAGGGLSGPVSSGDPGRSGPVLQPGQDRVPPEHVPHRRGDQGRRHEGNAAKTLFALNREAHRSATRGHCSRPCAFTNKRTFIFSNHKTSNRKNIYNKYMISNPFAIVLMYFLGQNSYR